jgi:hypothetical protein
MTLLLSASLPLQAALAPEFKKEYWGKLGEFVTKEWAGKAQVGDEQVGRGCCTGSAWDLHVPT